MSDADVLAAVDHGALADELFRADRTATPAPRPGERHPSFALEDGYRVQAEVVRRHTEGGTRVVGAKLGFTSEAMREQLGIAEPNYGWLTDGMLLAGPTVELDRLIHPRLEPEIGVRLSADLRGPGVTPADARVAVAGVFGALEVVDTRYPEYRFTLADNTADNSAAARVRAGPERPLGDLDLRVLGAVLERDGGIVGTAAGAAAMDDPLAALAWLADRMATHERGLRAGDIVITGGLLSALPLTAGDRFVAHFDHLGTVELEAR